MNAQEAKELSDQRATDIMIDGPLRVIMDAIKTAAQAGDYSIHNPFYACFNNNPPHHSQQDLMVKKLRSMGYDYKFHEDPDPGHPCSSSYEVLSW